MIMHPMYLITSIIFVLFDKAISKSIWSCTFGTPLYVCMYVCYIVALWAILSLMLTTSHPIAIGGVC